MGPPPRPRPSPSAARTATAAAARAPSALAAPYRPAVERILALAAKSDGGYAKLAHLTDHIGHRLSGSASLERAVFWAASAMMVDGLDNVHTETVMVPHWVRGEEHGEVLAPAQHRLHLLALGGSASTPPAGITAPVLVVKDFAELEAKKDLARGRVVVYDHPMAPYGPSGSGYGEAVVYRGEGPLRAAKLGAVAALVRSVTATSLRSPHTGATRFGPRPGDPPGEAPPAPIPAAAISVEDAALLSRLAQGPEAPVVHLVLGAQTLPDAESANVVGELRGRERPEEVVLLGAHLDSWDVGQGAHDDGAGCVMVMEALALLKKLELRPRRTLRVVLYTNEENGLRGALSYAAAHHHQLEQHVAAIEADSGGFKAVGFRAEASPLAKTQLAELLRLLEPIDAARLLDGHSGADVGALKAGGVELFGLEVEGSRYFDYHHSQADTLDKVRPEELRTGMAALAAAGYLIAELPFRLGQEAR